MRDALWDLGAGPHAAADPDAADAAPPADLAEERLLRGLRRGDAAAFETLYRRNAGLVYGLSYRLTGRAGDAEELTQEVFARAWEHRDGFRSVEHFTRWLKRVAVNGWINDLRRRETATRAGAEPGETELALDDDAPISRPATPGLKLDLERALGALSPRLRAVLLLFDLYGLSHAEIAEALGMTAGASKVQLHRARTRLQEMLQ